MLRPLKMFSENYKFLCHVLRKVIFTLNVILDRHANVERTAAQLAQFRPSWPTRYTLINGIVGAWLRTPPHGDRRAAADLAPCSPAPAVTPEDRGHCTQRTARSCKSEPEFPSLTPVLIIISSLSAGCSTQTRFTRWLRRAQKESVVRLANSRARRWREENQWRHLFCRIQH